MSLLKNSTWNFLGFIIPALAIIPAFGVIARLLDLEQFGIFTLCFAIMGYANLLDAGMARAVIRSISIEKNNKEKINKIISTASLTVLIISLTIGIIIYIYSNNFVQILNISNKYKNETENSLKLLALTMPAFLLSTVWFSYLEGLQKFYKLNILKTIYGLLMAIIPLGAVAYHPSLESSIIGLAFARYLTLLIAYFWSLPTRSPLKIFIFDKNCFKELFSFGGWITISNFISPIMVYFDRFFISSIVGAKDIAFYTIPSEAISRLSFLPASIVRVIFPRLSAKDLNSKKDTILTYWSIGTICTIVTLVGILGSKKILLIWMGEAYTGLAATIFSILLIGYLFNSLAQIPYAIIQAGGHSKITAFLHIIEFIPYILLLYFFVHEHGMIGAAAAWSIRVIFDCIALFFLSKKYY